MSMKDSLEQLLSLWVKYSTVYKNTLESTEEIRNKRREIRAELDKKGITEVEMFDINGDTYTLRYLQRGIRIFSKIDVPPAE